MARLLVERGPVRVHVFRAEHATAGRDCLVEESLVVQQGSSRRSRSSKRKDVEGDEDGVAASPEEVVELRPHDTIAPG